MILFWLFCFVMVGIALAFVLPPLMDRGNKLQSSNESSRREANLAVYRDQLSELTRDFENGLIGGEQHDQDRDELERRLLEDVSSADARGSNQTKQQVDGRSYVYVIALGIPLLSLALYLRLGNPNAMSATPRPTRQAAAAPEERAAPAEEGQPSQEQIASNVTALAKRLEENPDDLQGWTMLGRSYLSMEKYSDASAAFAKASALKPNDADLLSEYAFALAMANGQKLQGQPTELINKAVKLDPQNAKALDLAGSAAFEAKDYKRAADYWQKLLGKLPPGSDAVRELTARIEEAKSLAGNSK